MKLKLNSWFEIDESQYIWYILQGYTIKADEDFVSWTLDEKRHRTDGPAAIGANGALEWWLNGKLHREGGPACIWPGYSQDWYLNGKRHRTDGPAAVWVDGAHPNQWYLNDKYYTEEGWKDAIKQLG